MAEVVEAYIDEVRTATARTMSMSYLTKLDFPAQTQYDERFGKDTWRLGPDHIKFEDLYLIELRQITKASWQVSLGYRPHLPSVGTVGSQSGLVDV